MSIVALLRADLRAGFRADFRDFDLRAGLRAIGPSPARPAQHVHQLGDLAALLALVAGRDRVLDAVRDVVAQDLLLDPAQRSAHRRELRDHVDAVAVVHDHAGEPAHLALDAAQPLEAGGLGFTLHACYIPLR